jgi:pyruvate dehydrogenase E2 component (dihydrolipoamide acetyltransferase)
MPSDITMPQLSDTMTEGTLVKWLRKEGDKVKEGDKIAEIETDKAVMEMESFESGTLALQVVKEGQKVKVGALLAVIARSGDDVEAIKRSAPTATSLPAATPAATPAPVAIAASVASSPPAAPATASVVAVAIATPSEASSGSGRIRISPLAARIAAEKGIDPAAVAGTGPNGRIHKRDVESYLTSPPAPGRSAISPPTLAAPPSHTHAAASMPTLPAQRLAGTKEVVPLTKMRQVIAQRLQLSKQTIPHFYTTIDVDMENAMSLRERLNKQLEKERLKLSVNDLVMKAVACALVRHPAMNAHFRDTEIHRFADVNLGIAVALPDGLIVPVLRGVQNMGLREIRIRTADLVERARAQKLKGDELSGGTFTLSNLGAWGIRDFGAIVNPPEVGILAVASAEKRPVVRDNHIVARWQMCLTLSGDHRAVDGAAAADFLVTLRSHLEEPATMLV